MSRDDNQDCWQTQDQTQQNEGYDLRRRVDDGDGHCALVNHGPGMLERVKEVSTYQRRR